MPKPLLEEGGKSHVQEGRSTESPGPGCCLLHLQNWLQFGDGVCDEVNGPAAGVADDKADRRLVIFAEVPSVYQTDRYLSLALRPCGSSP